MIADPCLTASSGSGRMASSRLSILLALVFSSFSFVLSHSNRVMWFQDLFPPNVCPINAKANTFYGIMFDAGSTGTRIHIYTFVQKSPENLPELEGEIFESVKPGLSAYADQPEKGAETVKRLLDMAIDAVPPHLWKKTPVVLKATAGLRLLSEEKAQALLLEVKEVFEESPFLVPENSVSIMDGSYEDILPVGRCSEKVERIIMKLKQPMHGERLKSKICPYGPRGKEEEHKSLQVLDEAWCNAQYATRTNR